MNLRQAARAAGKSEQTLLAMIQAGTLPAQKIGRHWEITEEAVIDVLGWPGLTEQVRMLTDEMRRLRQTEERHDVEIARLKSEIARLSGHRQKRSDVARWLARHGISINTSQRWPLPLTDPTNAEALRFAQARIRQHPNRFKDARLHQCTDDLECACHTVL